MATLRMTIDPSFSHRVVEILNEKLWDGDIDGINSFMEESFGLTNHKLNAKILSGSYVMVFNEDGSGNVKPREELSTGEVEAMCGVPDELGVKEIREAIRVRVAGHTGLLERQKYVILNFRDLVINIHKVHSVDLDSRVLDSEVAKLLGNIDTDTMISTTLSTQEIIHIYNKAKESDASKDVIESIKDAGGDAAKLIYIMDEVDRLFKEQAALIKAMDYIKEYIFDDIRNIDMYKANGTKSNFDEQIEDPGRYFWMQDFYSRCSEINEYYQFLLADREQQKLMSNQAKANEMITHAAVHSMSDFDHDERDMGESHSTGNPLLDAYLKSAQSESPTGPVKPEADKWDAGWISPEGAFWADKGTTANFLHLNLADSIKEYYGNTFDWLANAENPDRELEKHGWLKFHHSEVGFTGYTDCWNSGKQHTITNRQIDKLHDYAKHMGFENLHVAVTEKRIKVAEMYNYTKDEWREIFEW